MLALFDSPDAQQLRFQFHNAWQTMRQQTGAHIVNAALLIFFIAALVQASIALPGLVQRNWPWLIVFLLVLLGLRCVRRAHKAFMQRANDWLAGQPIAALLRWRWCKLSAATWMLFETILLAAGLAWTLHMKAAIAILSAGFALASVLFVLLPKPSQHTQTLALDRSSFLVQFFGQSLFGRRLVYCVLAACALGWLAHHVAPNLLAPLWLLCGLGLVIYFSAVAAKVNGDLYHHTRVLSGQAVAHNFLYLNALRTLIRAAPALALPAFMPLLVSNADLQSRLTLSVIVTAGIAALMLSALHFSFAHRRFALDASARTTRSLILITLFVLLLQAIPQLLLLLPGLWWLGYRYGNKEAHLHD